MESDAERQRHDSGDGGGRPAGGASTNWDWIYGRVATSLGVLPSAIDDEPAINIFGLLEYWGEEPPTHVILALRYLGQRKAPAKSDAETENDLAELAVMPGMAAEPVSDKTRELAAYAEEVLTKLRKGTERSNGRKS
jgi:hypothetical protein